MNSEKTSPLFAEERRQQILLLLEQNDKLLVPELCEIFQVSPATIRNDLNILADNHQIQRTHGGAIPIKKTAFEPTNQDKSITHPEKKSRIASCAFDMIEDGDTLAIDAGTTTLELARLLNRKQNLTVVINDLAIASVLEEYKNVNVVVLGGMLRHGFQCTVGPLTLSSLSSINVDKAFIATNAFSFEKGFTTPDFNQSEVKKAMMNSASKTIMLCDSSKIGKVNFIEFATLSSFDDFITDTNITPDNKKKLEELSQTTALHFA